jgi:hypothetical protein
MPVRTSAGDNDGLYGLAKSITRIALHQLTLRLYVRLLRLSHRADHASGCGRDCGYAHAHWSGCVSDHGRGCVNGHGRGREMQYESGGYACCSCSVRCVYSDYGCDRGRV